MSRILYCGAHSILSYDEIRLFHELGHDVWDLGSYIVPSAPHDPKRPALPQIPDHPDLKAVVDALGQQGFVDTMGEAKTHLPDAILDWAEIVIFAAMEHTWLAPQWPRLRASGKRIVWRTIGQSVRHSEVLMAPLFADGLEIVRYSPREATIPGYAGATAVIRFYKDPADFAPWIGDWPLVTNVTQHLKQRDPYTNWAFWEAATYDLPRMPIGPGSEEIGGPGQVTYDDMRDRLRHSRAYLYCGTQPASYTLGFIEALMAGIPVVSIGPAHMRVYPEGPALFEAHEHATDWSDDPTEVRALLRDTLADKLGIGRDPDHAIATFGKDVIAPQWRAFLDG